MAAASFLKSDCWIKAEKLYVYESNPKCQTIIMVLKVLRVLSVVRQWVLNWFETYVDVESFIQSIDCKFLTEILNSDCS